MGQIQQPPFRIVKLRLGEGEVAGLGKISLTVSEPEVTSRISAVPELELPTEIEEKLFARRGGSCCICRGVQRIPCKDCGSAPPGRADQ